jgi:DNA-binding NtrC family response regulator
MRPDRKTIDELIAYHWPGNVRQLQNVLKRIVILGTGKDVLDELRQGDSEFGEGKSRAAVNPIQKVPSILNSPIDFDGEASPDLSSFSLKDIRKKALDKVEYDAILYILTKTNWNRSKAAKILQVSYKTLLSKISELNIEPPSSV